MHLDRVHNPAEIYGRKVLSSSEIFFIETFEKLCSFSDQMATRTPGSV